MSRGQQHCHLRTVSFDLWHRLEQYYRLTTQGVFYVLKRGEKGRRGSPIIRENSLDQS